MKYFALVITMLAVVSEALWNLDLDNNSLALLEQSARIVKSSVGEDPVDLCEHLLIQADAKEQSQESFVEYCENRTLNTTICQDMMVSLGAHPWLVKHIRTVCAKPEVSSMFGEQEEFVLMDSPVAFCKHLMQSAENSELSCTDFEAFCATNSIPKGLCGDLEFRLGPHPWTGSGIENACDSEQVAREFGKARNLMETSCTDLESTCDDLIDTCQSNRPWMHINCPVACEFCTEDTAQKEDAPDVKLKTAWDGPFVDVSCAGVAGVTALLEEEVISLEQEMQPAISHWSIRRFNVNRGFQSQMGYYASADIEVDVPNMAALAVISYHGAMRNAVDYFCTLRKVMLEQTAYSPELTLMIVPKFTYGIDDPVEGDLYWNGSKPWGDYRVGANSDARSGGEVSSFDVIDRLVEILADQSNYPNLRDIVMMGHSAGGQTVQRYAMTTHFPLHLAPNLKFKFAIANPSSYTYLDSNRWSYDCTAEGCSDNPEYLPYDRNLGRSDWKPGDRRRRRAAEAGFGWSVLGSARDKKFVCRSYEANDWGYGFNWEHIEGGFSVPYIAEHPDIKANLELYKQRNIIYMVGQNDTCTDDIMPYGCDDSCWLRHEVGGRYEQTCYRNRMDMRCQAMLMGWNRNIRGKLYMKHLEHYYGEPVHELYEIPGAGHEGEKMFMSKIARAVLFQDNYDREVAADAKRAASFTAEELKEANEARRVASQDAQAVYHQAVVDQMEARTHHLQNAARARRGEEPLPHSQDETIIPEEVNDDGVIHDTAQSEETAECAADSGCGDGASCYNGICRTPDDNYYYLSNQQPNLSDVQDYYYGGDMQGRNQENLDDQYDAFNKHLAAVPKQYDPVQLVPFANITETTGYDTAEVPPVDLRVAPASSNVIEKIERMAASVENVDASGGVEHLAYAPEPMAPPPSRNPVPESMQPSILDDLSTSLTGAELLSDAVTGVSSPAADVHLEGAAAQSPLVQVHEDTAKNMSDIRKKLQAATWR